MQFVRTVEELRAAVQLLKSDGRLALVPTMGALHSGHMALVEEAKRRAERVAATIFVNPMQFGAGEDLDRYPRRESDDADMLREAGCDLLWLPSVGDTFSDRSGVYEIVDMDRRRIDKLGFTPRIEEEG